MKFPLQKIAVRIIFIIIYIKYHHHIKRVVQMYALVFFVRFFGPRKRQRHTTFIHLKTISQLVNRITVCHFRRDLIGYFLADFRRILFRHIILVYVQFVRITVVIWGKFAKWEHSRRSFYDKLSCSRPHERTIHSQLDRNPSREWNNTTFMTQSDNRDIKFPFRPINAHF